MNNDWRTHHGEVISDFLAYLNRHSEDYILKGGTSLMMCYNLDRFSEDIDLDCARSKQIKSVVDSFCNTKGYSYRIAKDTDTVKRFMINYGLQEKPLKIEISYRKRVIDKSEYSKINGIVVYNIDSICMMKVNAYTSRDKIRDLYDLTFICNNYWDNLSTPVKNMVKNCVEFKGLEQFDYLISQQSDPLINNDKLAEDFLNMYEKLGLWIGEDEQELVAGFSSQAEKKEVSKDSPKTFVFSRKQMNDNAEKISRQSRTQNHKSARLDNDISDKKKGSDPR